MIGVESLCACRLGVGTGEGRVHGLTGCTEPGTEWTRMTIRVMIPVLELVHDEMRADQED
ncbi:MAG TPA: hypothetical protein DDY39_04055 [Nitrospira sp.]|nr:hypothetical protein [Nitrospira sp.]